MSKVTITNVSKSQAPMSLNFKDHSSAILSYRKSITVEEDLLTPYIRRMTRTGDFKIKKLGDSKPPVKKFTEEDAPKKESKKEDKKV